MKFLFLFMDGIGLGGEDPNTNPFAKAAMPNLIELLGGRRLVRAASPADGERASLRALDAQMGMEGLPQSATGQAALLTGENVPELVGEHYGPKPNKAVAKVIEQGTVFQELQERGYQVALLNSYPERYFEGIHSGKRLYSAIPLAMTKAGVKLKTADDLHNGEAISADFTGEGWRRIFNDGKAPVMDPHEAGVYLAELVWGYDLAFFEYWPSDFAGHKQDEAEAVRLLENFDGVLGGLIEKWDDEQGLILITSDHGNMEDLSTRRHTANLVPALVIGGKEMRRQFCRDLKTLADVAPAIRALYP